MADLTPQQKAKVVSLARKRMASKASLLYLYDPVNDRCLPAVCDPQGFIKIDPEELDARYYKKKEDVDLEGYDIHNFTEIIPTGINVGVLGNSSHPLDSARIRALTNQVIYSYTNLYSIFARNESGDCIQLVTLYGGTKIVLRAVDGRCDIPLAGNIAFVAGKKFLSDIWIDDAKGIQWSDVNLYRSAANVLMTSDNFRIADGMELRWSDVNLYRSLANLLQTDDSFLAHTLGTTVGKITAKAGFIDDTAIGVDGTFNDADAKVVTVSGGIITNLDT